jgi:hypothetical protein
MGARLWLGSGVLALALGALPPRPAQAVELTVDGPTVEDARRPGDVGRTPQVGDELYIRCLLSAQAPGVADTVSFVFRVEGTVIREVRVPVGSGAPVAIGEYWTPRTPGLYRVTCEVNPDRQIEESTYRDNVGQRVVEVLASAPRPPPAAAPPPTTSPAALPDLAIVTAATVADPGCGPGEPSVTAQVTVKNVGPAAFTPPRSASLLEVTVKIANGTTLLGRSAVPPLAPGESVEIEVAARSRTALPDAGGLRYSAVAIVNGTRQAEEVTLNNNGEYVKSAFPRC